MTTLQRCHVLAVLRGISIINVAVRLTRLTATMQNFLDHYSTALIYMSLLLL